jgi:hypothetical protein
VRETTAEDDRIRPGTVAAPVSRAFVRMDEDRAYLLVNPGAARRRVRNQLDVLVSGRLTE